MKREEILEIYKEECSKSDKTRDRQWKFNISLWTLLALAIWFFDDKKEDSFSDCIILISLMFTLISHFLFIYLTQRALNAYKLMSKTALDALNESNADSIDFKHRYFNEVPFDGWNWLWVLCQIIPTIMLLIVFSIRV